MADPHQELGVDWFGNPLGPREGGPRPPVPCPLCAEPFTDHAELATHVTTDHDVKLRSERAPRLGRVQAWWRSLGFLPLWFVVPITIALATVAYALVRPVDPWLAAYAAVLASLPLVLALSQRVFGPKR